jgi:hypothetical protein
MGLPVRGQRTRTQVSRRCLWGGIGVRFGFADIDVADYDCEEVQPHRQAQISSGVLFASFFSLFFSRLAYRQAEPARRTERIHLCKDTNVQKTLLRERI